MNWKALVAAIAFFVALPVVARSAAPNEKESGTDTELKPSLLRYEEDYSYLQDPTKRTGVWWAS